MALFKRRLRSPKGWNEITAVVIEMQEVLESWAANVALAVSRIQARVSELENAEPEIMEDTVPFAVPRRLVAKAGETVYIGTAIEGESYQWQLSTNGGSSWQNSTASTAATKTIAVSATSGRNGYRYRCKVTKADGSTVTSDAIALVVI